MTTVTAQTKRIDTLEKRMDRTDLTQSKHTSELIHLKNDMLHLKNTKNHNVGIVTGVNIRRNAAKDFIISALEVVLNLTDLKCSDVVDVDTIPWGNGVAVKCTFENAGMVGKLLRNSINLKGSNFRVLPDLSPQQRLVRKHLLTFGKDLIEGKASVSFQLKSWRYLVFK
ncbi:unnamed protein product, partial [Allacma fusca]